MVGGGFGGLAAAIRLAGAGHDVTVLERRDQLGGRASQWVLDGFRFDAGPTVLTAPHLFEELFTLAGERLADHVTLVPLDPYYRVFDDDGAPFDFRTDEAAMLAQVARLSPADVPGYQRLQSRIAAIFDAFHPYTERSMMSLPAMLRMLPYLLEHRAMLGVRHLVHGTVRDPFLRRALTFHPLLIGGDPARTPALFALLVEFELRWGVHYAIGGTAAVVAALGGLLERLGGRIELGAEVERILVERGRVTGVRLADGTTRPADVVVSDADPGHVSGTLLAHEPRAAAARVRQGWARPSMSLHVLYLGADRTWPDTPLAHHNILYAGDPEQALTRVRACSPAGPAVPPRTTAWCCPWCWTPPAGPPSSSCSTPPPSPRWPVPSCRTPCCSGTTASSTTTSPVRAARPPASRRRAVASGRRPTRGGRTGRSSPASRGPRGASRTSPPPRGRRPTPAGRRTASPG